MIVIMLDEILLNHTMIQENLATILDNLRPEGVENSESEEPLQSTPLSCS